jgi:hypothetical protein
MARDRPGFLLFFPFFSLERVRGSTLDTWVPRHTVFFELASFGSTTVMSVHHCHLYLMLRNRSPTIQIPRMPAMMAVGPTYLEGGDGRGEGEV